MDKVDKKLKVLDRRTRDRVLKVFKQLELGQTSELDIKALKGRDGVFRARVGELRVIFIKTPRGVEILDLAHRTEKTYKKI